MLSVGDYMTENVIVITPRDTLLHARNLMLRHGVGRLVVVEDGKVKGIITLTDILYSMSLPEFYYKPLVDILVKEVMTPNPITVTEITDVREACEYLVKYNIGGLPVVNEENALVGIFTRTDALRAYSENAEEVVPVSQVADTSPPKVTPYSSLRKVIESMESKPYMKTLVVDGDSLVGIITKKDVVYTQIPVKSLDKPFLKRDTVLMKGKTGAVRTYIVPIAADVMTPSPVTCLTTEDLKTIAITMLEYKIGGVPVLDEKGSVYGLVTKHHIIEELSKTKI